MAPGGQPEWEVRAARPAAFAAFAALALLVANAVYSIAALDRPTGDAHEVLIAVDEQPGGHLLAQGLEALGTALLGAVLWYLYRAAKHRRPELPRVAGVLAIAGPLAVAGLSFASQAELNRVADDFASTGERTALLEDLPAADRRTAETRAEDRAEDLIKDSNLQVIGGVRLGAGLAIGFAFVLISLNAMRAGIVSRFMGVIGIIIGALYVLPLFGGPQIIQLFWLGALGLLILDRWPGGRGEAWSSGEAKPWPSVAEQRAALERSRGGGDPEASPPEEAAAAVDGEPAPARGPSRKRKRKRR